MLGALFWKPITWSIKRAQILYWQNQCLNYEAPADLVVYEGRHDAAAMLLAQNDNYIEGPGGAAMYVPSCWRHLNKLLGGDKPEYAILGMHERQERDTGRHVLVVIRCNAYSSPEAYVYKLGTWTQPILDISSNTSNRSRDTDSADASDQWLEQREVPTRTLLALQPDPDIPSAFTGAFEPGSGSHTYTFDISTTACTAIYNGKNTWRR